MSQSPYAFEITYPVNAAIVHYYMSHEEVDYLSLDAKNYQLEKDGKKHSISRAKDLSFTEVQEAFSAFNLDLKRFEFYLIAHAEDTRKIIARS